MGGTCARDVSAVDRPFVASTLGVGSEDKPLTDGTPLCHSGQRPRRFCCSGVFGTLVMEAGSPWLLSFFVSGQALEGARCSGPRPLPRSVQARLTLAQVSARVVDCLPLSDSSGCPFHTRLCGRGK